MCGRFWAHRSVILVSPGNESRHDCWPQIRSARGRATARVMSGNGSVSPAGGESRKSDALGWVRARCDFSLACASNHNTLGFLCFSDADGCQSRRGAANRAAKSYESFWLRVEGFSAPYTHCASVAHRRACGAATRDCQQGPECG